MKKLFILAIVSLWAIAVNAADVKAVYLHPNSDWKTADAKFGVYYWNSETSGFSSIMVVDAVSGYYVADIPSSATSVIFIRLNPSATRPSFENGVKWNQTQDLSLSSGNLCTITGWNTGVMSQYTPPTNPEKFTLTITAGVGGSIDESVNKEYYEGATVTVKAQPAVGYDFLKWSDNVTDNPRDILMTGDIALTAYFVQADTYTFTVQLKNAACAGYEDVYLYAWDANGNILLGDWPGTKIEEPYLYKFVNSPAVNIIWNDGGKHNKQTDDILNVSTDNIYTLNCEETYTYTVNVDYFKCSAWGALYLYAWGDNDYRPLGDFPGTKLEPPYTYTFENEPALNILISDGTSDNQSSDFTDINEDIRIYFPCGNTFDFSVKHAGCTDWEHIYVYAWDEEGVEPLGAFPGIELSAPYTIPFENSAPLNFVVSDGTETNKSDDILDIYGNYSYVFPCDKSFDFTVNNVNCTGWEHLYVYAWDEGGVEPFGTFPGWLVEYPYKLSLENVATMNFVLSDGTSENKTDDITGISSDYTYSFECVDPTALEESTADILSTRKILRDGRLYILQDGRMYTVQGQEVK